MKQFATAARRGEGGVPKPVDVQFEFETEPGQFVVMTAHPPTTGQIALFMAEQSEGGVAVVRASFAFLRYVLDDGEWNVIEAKLADGLDVLVVTDIISYLIEEWGARPTQPPSVSPGSPPTNGQRSTAKRRAAASTT